jgi:hypothetical protein
MVMAKGKENKNEEQNENSSQTSAERAGELNEQKNQAQIAADEAEKKKKEKEESDAQPNPINKGTSRLLKAAWENLPDSFGLTLIWIDIHIFLGMVLGNKMFCKLGMEWVPDSLKQAQFKKAEMLGKTAGTIEGTGVACLNLGCLFIVIANLMIIAMMLDVIENPMSFFAENIGYMWDAAIDAVTAWVQS